MKETQETRKLNSTEVLLPSEIQPDAMAISFIPSQSPMDLPVERFISALNRRETNRKAIIKRIAGNLVMGTDFSRIHVVGKEKCSMAKEGLVHQCHNHRHWSKPSLWKPGAEQICGMLGLISRFPNLGEYEILCSGEIGEKSAHIHATLRVAGLWTKRELNAERTPATNCHETNQWLII
jgi:hypothetical protein